MAMTKAEQAHVAKLEKDLREARALRFTEPVMPDLPEPKGFQATYTSGFSAHYYNGNFKVSPAWSGSVTHGIGYASKEEQDKAGSSGRQNAAALYSTRLMALRAVRNTVEHEASRILARVDAEIESEIAAAMQEAQPS